MVETGITAVIHLMEEDVDGYTVRNFLSRALVEYQRGDIDEEVYFSKLASILSNASVALDRAMVEQLFLPWRETKLEKCGARRGFWLLLEQLSYHADPGDNPDEFYDWLDAIVGNAVVYSDQYADEPLGLMLDHLWFNEGMRNRVCLWIFYNAALGKMHLRPVSQRLVKAAANHTSSYLGRGGLAKEVLAFRAREEGSPGTADD